MCKLHGGKSTFPRIAEGRQRCVEARLLHGEETTAKRNKRRLANARLAVLEMTGHPLGLMHGTRTSGRKPSQTPEAYPQLQQAARQILLRNATSRG